MTTRRSLIPALLAGLLSLAIRAAPPVCAAPPGPDPTREAAGALEAARRGDLIAAIAMSERAVAAAPSSATAYSVRGYILSLAGRREDAVAAYLRAGQLDSKDVVSRTNRGCVLLAMGKASDALKAFSEAVDVDPRSARAENGRGAAFERLGRMDDARAAYRHAIELNPAEAVAYNNLGALALRRGAEGPAAARFAKAMELDPRFDAPLANMALLAMGRDSQKGEADLLAAAAKPGASAEVKARARALAADRAARERRWGDAAAYYAETLVTLPNDVDALNNLAVAEDQLGRTREALAHLDAAMELDPQNVNIENNVGIVHVHRNDLARAEQVFREVIRSDARFHRAHYNLGVVLGARGDRAGALAEFRLAADLAPKDAAAAYNLGMMTREGGAGAAAERAAYERAISLDPSLAEAHLSLGTLLADPETPASVRDEVEARVHLKRFLELSFTDDESGRRQALDWLAWLNTPRPK